MGQEMKGFNEPIQVIQSFLPPIEEFQKKIEKIWETHWMTNNGPLHNELEEAIARYLKVEHTVLFNNGHLALDLAIKALGLEGEVITTPFTFASTTHAIVMNGLTPIFCDINPRDFTMDVSQIESLITEGTSAILPVHVYGHPCDVAAIDRIAKRYHLKVIYDAAHVFGVEIDGKGIGQYGDISMFSLHATKVYNAIEGGVLTCQDPLIKAKLRLLKNFGITGTESVEEVGLNAKMNEFQAAMGLVNLTHLEAEIDKRKELTAIYREGLSQIKGIELGEVPSGIKANYAYLPIIINEDQGHISRNELHEALKKYNIFTRKYFYPLITDFKCYQGKYKDSQIPYAKKIAESVLTLPLYGALKKEECQKIISIIQHIVCNK